MNKMFKRGAVVAAGVLGAVAANAAAIDVTAVATAVSDVIVPITTIGSGVLLVMVALKTFNWVRSAIR